MNLSSSYHLYRVINPVLFISLMVGLVGIYYLVRPSTVKTTDPFIDIVDVVGYRKATVYREQTLTKETTQENRVTALKHLAELYWQANSLSDYKETIKQLYEFGYRDEAYFEEVLRKAYSLWEKEKTHKEKQDMVIFFLTLLGKGDDLKKFLIWNQRLEDVLARYENDWQSDKQFNVEMALKVALWSDKTDLKIRWMERSLAMQRGDNKLREDLVSLYMDKQDYQNALIHLGSPQTPTDYETLAYLYHKMGDEKNAAATYWQAYQHFQEVKFLERAYFTAKEAYREAESFKYLSQLADYKPEYALSLAESYVQQGQKVSAIATYKKAWQKWRHLPALRAGYNLAYQLNDRQNMKAFLHELSQHTDDQESLKNLAVLHIEAKQYQKAEQVLRKLVALEPKNKEYQESIAYVYVKNGKRRKAMNAYYSIWKKWGDLTALKYSYSLAYDIRDKRKMAELLRPLYQRTKDKDYLYKLAALYSEQPEKLAELMEQYPFLRQQSFLGNYYLYKKDYHKAASFYWKLAIKHPRDHQYTEKLAYVYTQMGQLEKASTLYEKLYAVSRSTQKKKEYLETLAYLYLKTEQSEKALLAYKKLYQMDKKYASAYLNAAYRAGKQPYANTLEFIYQQEPKLEYGDQLARHYLYVQQDYSKATTILEKLLQQTGQEDYRLMLAYAYGESGQPGKKVAVLEQVPLPQMSSDIAIAIAEVYQQNGRWESAIRLLEKWVEVQRFEVQNNDTVSLIQVLKHQAGLYQRLGEEHRFQETNQHLAQLLAGRRIVP